MAVVETLFDVGFLIVDAKKKSSIMSIPLGVPEGDTDLTLADLVLVANALEALIDPVIRGDLKRAWVTIGLNRYTNNTLENDDVDVEEGVLYTLVAQGTDKRKVMRVPTFNESYIIDGTALVDHTATVVENFDEFFISGITVNSKDVRPCDSEGRIIEAYYSAEEDFRRRAKPRR